MRVLHIVSSLEIGGAQRLLSDLLPIQKQAGIHLCLLVLKTENNIFSKKIENAGIPVISLNTRNFRNPFLAIKVRHIIRQYDIVHAHLVHALYICSIAALGLRTKLVYTEHSTSNNRREKLWLRPIEKYVYRRYKRIISISKQTQNALQDWLQSKDNRFEVINNGIDTNAFSVVKKTKIPKSLIMVSRFAASKDQETVIRAMRRLDKNITLRFVGDGDNLEHCKQVASECEVEDRIEFLGTRTDVAELIAESYVGIQSSNWEGFGLTAVEIMAAGLPIIVTDVDGLKQVVDGAGILFRVGDEKNLSDIIKKIMSNSALYIKMAMNSRKKAAEYDINITAKKYVQLYKMVLDE